MRLQSHPAEVSPVQEVTQTLCSVSLDDPLASALFAELEEEGGELVTGLVYPSVPPVQDVNTCKERQCAERGNIFVFIIVIIHTSYEHLITVWFFSYPSYFSGHTVHPIHNTQIIVISSQYWCPSGLDPGSPSVYYQSPSP